MMETIRFGDITGYDDADVFDMDDDVYLIIDTQEDTGNDNEQQNL